MAVVFALEKLFDDVEATFASEGAGITQSFGWREPASQLVQPAHIDWVPGDDVSGDFGKIQGPKYPGGNPRSLWTPRELFTCIIQGYDATAPHVERAQYRATRLVFDAWLRAIYLAAHGTVVVDSTRWIVKRKDGRFGATLRVVGAILGKTPDSANASAPADVKAAITLTKLSVVETYDVNPKQL